MQRTSNKKGNKSINVEQAIAEINKNDIIERELKCKIKGFLGNINQPKAGEELEKIKKDRIITEHELKAWKDNRNPAAHGVLFEQNQDRYDQYLRIISLLYKIIYYLINYNGQYTDYGTNNWPYKKIEKRSE